MTITTAPRTSWHVTPPPGTPRKDTLPEGGIANGYYATANEAGCEAIDAKCTECPLPMCLEDQPAFTARLAARNDAIVRMSKRGRSQEAVAKKHGVSTRTVYRVCEKAKEKT